MSAGFLDAGTTAKINNEITGNGTAQIFMRYAAGAYMNMGHNNIYYSQPGTVHPEVPCIKGIIQLSPYDYERCGAD